MKLISPELQAGGKRLRYTTLFGPWALLSILAAGTIALFVIVTTQGAGVASGWNDSLFYCDSSGRIRYEFSDNDYNNVSPYWDKELFLSVTMGFHGLTFVQAKAIDICFDLVIGRGSQVLTALASYPILRRSILRSMEAREFSLALLLPFFLEKLSIYSLWAMFAYMRARRRKPKTDEQTERIKFRKAKIRIDWRVILVFLVGCYVLALPTFTSVMTSYQARSAPYILTADRSGYVSTTDLRIPDFILPDGGLFGLPQDFPLYNDSNADIVPTLAAYDAAYMGNITQIREDTLRTYIRALAAVHNDDYAIRKAAFDRTRDSFPLKQVVADEHDPPQWSFTFWPRNVTFIGGSPTYRGTELDSMIIIRNITRELNGALDITRNKDPSEDLSGETWFAYDNITFMASEITAQGRCLPSDEYIWGFSSLILFTFCMITISVALFLITLHYDAYFNSAADRYKLSISPYRDVLDLAEELRAHYGNAETANMPAKELDRVMREDPVATGLETETLHRSRRARWKQAKASKRSFARSDMRKRPKVAESQVIDAEESLMSMGFDAQLHSEMEMAKLPARVSSRSTTNT